MSQTSTRLTRCCLRSLPGWSQGPAGCGNATAAPLLRAGIEPKTLDDGASRRWIRGHRRAGPLSHQDAATFRMTLWAWRERDKPAQSRDSAWMRAEVSPDLKAALEPLFG